MPTLQVHSRGAWRDAATLEMSDPAAGPSGRCYLTYDFDYALAHLPGGEPAEVGGIEAIGCNYPVTLDGRACERWPAVLDDLRPSGAARRWWVDHLDLGRLPQRQQEYPLLVKGALAPIGNVRVREAVPDKPRVTPRFPATDVIAGDRDFLERAAAEGAAVGGASGAGGEAFKLLLRLDAEERVWIDAHQDEEAPDASYLVKFPRGRSERDRLILASEHVYYQALARLGVEAVAVEGLRFHAPQDAAPSLWMPRFDVRRAPDGSTVRLGMESLYSLVEAGPGSFQAHQTFLGALFRVLAPSDPVALVVEYLRRDLLNLVFGNSDNHGRNSAVLRTPEGVRLAPVFDVAPMKMDDEVVTRTTRWATFEVGGRVEWRALVDSLGHLADPDLVWQGLTAFAARLVELPAVLEALDLPAPTLDFAPIGLRRTEARLADWGLLP